MGRGVGRQKMQQISLAGEDEGYELPFFFFFLLQRIDQNVLFLHFPA